MAYTAFGVNDAMAVKLWSKAVTVAMREKLEIAPLIGKSADSIIQLNDQMSKGPGDKVTCALRGRLAGDGVSEGEVAEGNGESLSMYSDSVLINELGHVVSSWSENSIDAQRVPFSMREQGKDALAEWYAERISKSFFNQVCGYTPQTNLKYSGMNAVVAISGTDRHVVHEAGSTTDEALDSNDTFSLEAIDYAKEKAKVGDQALRPIKIGGQDRFVMYLHPYQVTSLRTNTGTTQWNAIQQSALAGAGKHGLYDGSLGEYNGVILRESQDVTQGVNSSTGAAITTVRRAVLLGAQAATIAYGRKGGQDRMRWSEELLDHKRKLEIGCFNIFGLKKMVWNSKDHGVIVVSTYAAAS